jgi:hypothetical protein
MGLQEIVPREFLVIFTPEMLHLLVCGVADVDPDELEKVLECSPTDFRNDIIVSWFMECVRDMSPQDRCLLLAFSTGASTLPAGNSKFRIMRGDDNTAALPTAHTCFNSIVLPRYTSKEQLEEKLLIAIRNAAASDFGFA